MRNGLDAVEMDAGPNRSRRMLGVVILLLFITGCIGLQVLIYLASSGTENRLWQVGILANSTADYSSDEIIQVAPISPEILEELARDDARSSPTPDKATTPPVIGQVIPTQTKGSAETATPGSSSTVSPTPVQTGSATPVTPTPVTPTLTTPTSRTPTTQTPTPSPTTPAPTTPVPTTQVPTTRVPTTPVPTTRVPTTPVATTTIPPTPIPTTKVPTTPVVTTTIPPTPVPTTQAPTPTPIPTSTGLTEIPTPWIPPTDPPTPTEENPPGSGLDGISTPTPPLRLVPPRLDLFFQKLGPAPQSCQLGDESSFLIYVTRKTVIRTGISTQVRIELSFFSDRRTWSMA